MAFLLCDPPAALANQKNRARALDTAPLMAIEVFKPSIEPSAPGIDLDPLPITWAADWRALHPAATIAPPAPLVLERTSSDSALFKKLYASYAAVQFGDVITTTMALNRGAHEANPLIGDGRARARLIGVKAATTVVTVLAIEKLRKRHPVAAGITFAALNATFAAVTINNVSAARRANRVDP